MSNETTTGLKRVTYLPDRDVTDNGRLIAGQDYDDVYFTGGTIENATLINVTIEGAVVTEITERVIEFGSSTSVLLSDGSIIVLWNSASGAAKTTTIPTSTGSKQKIIVQDAYGDSEDYPITIAPVSGFINKDLSSVEISTSQGSITLFDSSIGWRIEW